MVLTNLLLKPKCMLKPSLNVFVLCIKKNNMIFFVIGEYDVMNFLFFIFIFERLGRMHLKQKNICFFFNFMFFFMS